MAVRPINTLKAWFVTLAKPPQDQFWDWLDSFRHKSDTIPMADVTDLITTVNSLLPKTTFDAYEQGNLVAANDDYLYVIPGGYLLEGIIANYGVDGSMLVSKVVMGDGEVLTKDDVVAGWNEIVMLNIFAPANTNLYIAGVPAGSKLNFLIRKIKMV
jgi:hypothetical protein